MNNEEMIKMLLEKQENIEQKLLTIRRVGDEQLWAQVFHDTIKGSRWLPTDFLSTSFFNNILNYRKHPILSDWILRTKI